MLAKSTDRPDLHSSPRELLSRWPTGAGLVALLSGTTSGDGRWSILAEPDDWVVLSPDQDPSALLDQLPARRSGRPFSPDHPFGPGWIGILGYELGRRLEPAAAGPARPAPDRDWPDTALARCTSALVHDQETDEWFGVGPAWRRLVEQLSPAPAASASGEDPAIGPVHSSLERAAYLAAVERSLEYIAAGDIFQVNLTQRLTATFCGSPRGLAATALQTSGARHGAYVELPGCGALISMSPELFLEVDATNGRITSAPIKGTSPRQSDARHLEASAKDTAELHMIVDLMRNDLGRVCEYGTVRVPGGRRIESHAAVHHGVATVTGVLRDEVTTAELLRATFPAGSITGAPKIRAMQIIEELEPAPRGIYCGAIGFFGDDGAVRLNVAIRSMTVSGVRGADGVIDGTIDYGAGGGIVADSSPQGEYEESLLKAQPFRTAIDQV